MYPAGSGFMALFVATAPAIVIEGLGPVGGYAPQLEARAAALLARTGDGTARRAYGRHNGRYHCGGARANCVRHCWLSCRGGRGRRYWGLVRRPSLGPLAATLATLIYFNQRIRF